MSIRNQEGQYMIEEDQYSKIRKAVYNQRFITWMKNEYLTIDSEKTENETTELYDELQKVLDGKPSIPAIVVLCEATCKIYKDINDDTIKM